MTNTHAVTPGTKPSTRPARRWKAISFLLAGFLLASCAPTATTATEPAATPPPSKGSSIAESEQITLNQMLDALPVREFSDVEGYERDKFGDGWQDPDGNGCDARNDMLQRDLTELVIEPDGCTVLSGVLPVGPFTGEQIVFERGGSSEIDIDHLVALADAWDSGASEWGKKKRVAFANDPNNLLAVSASANRSKGADSFDEWQPPNEEFWCGYANLIVGVKTTYELTVTQPEKDALASALATC